MTAPTCPICHGPMFDETLSKFWNGGLTDQGKKKPAWKCRKKGECKGVIWEHQAQAANAPAGQPEAKATHRGVPSEAHLQDIFATYKACFAEATKIALEYADEYPKEIANRIDIPAMASTMMIQAFK